MLCGAVRTAEHLPICFDAMPDNSAAAVIAGGRERLDGAFKTVEDVLASDTSKVLS
jgi:hypothetical protein